MDRASLAILMAIAVWVGGWVAAVEYHKRHPAPLPLARHRVSYCPAPIDPLYHGLPGYVRGFEPCSWHNHEANT